MGFGFKREKNSEVAFKAGIWSVISNIVVKAISVITTPIFTRLMSTEEYGTVQTFISWNVLLLPAFTLNLTYSIGRAKLDFLNKWDKYLGSMQVLSAFFSLILSTIAILFIRPISDLLELNVLESVLLIIYLFFEPSIYLYQDIYRYRYKYKYNIAIAWYITFSTTILSLGMVWRINGSKADLRIIGIIIPTVALSVFFWISSLKERYLNINLHYWKYGLRISVPLILHTVSMHILSQSDRIFISKICGKSETGIYSLAYTYGMLLHTFITSVSEGWLPWFHDAYYTKKYDDIRENTKTLVVLVCFIGLACIAFAPESVLIFGGRKYAESVVCVPPVVLGVVCQYIYTHYVNIELHMKKTLYVSNGTIFAAILNIILNAIFIPKFGYIAAAYTTLASYMALMFIHFFINKRILHIHLYSDIFMFGALCVTVIISAILIPTYRYNAIRYILISIGFVFFLFYFRKYIKFWLKKRKK